MLVRPSQLPDREHSPATQQSNLIVVKIPISRSVREVKPISVLDMTLYLGGEEEEAKQIRLHVCWQRFLLPFIPFHKASIVCAF